MKCVSRMVITMVIVLLLAAPILAAGTQVVNFGQAVQLTLTNNLDLKIAALTLANSQIDLEKSQLLSNAETRSQQLSLKLDLAKSEDTYRTTRYNVLLSLLTDFTELTKKRQTIESNENLLKIKELDLKLTTDLFNKGSSTPTELTNARIALEEQKLSLSKSKEDYAKLVDNLKTKTGLTGEVQFVELTMPVTKVTQDLATALELAALASYDLKDKETRYQLAVLDVEKGELEQKPELELKKLRNAQEMAQYRYLQAEADLTQKVKDQLWNLAQTEKNLEVELTRLDIAKESFQQTQTGYQKGYYTETQLLQAKNSLINAEKALFTVKVDYTTKRVQLLQTMGLDVDFGGEIK